MPDNNITSDSNVPIENNSSTRLPTSSSDVAPDLLEDLNFRDFTQSEGTVN